MLIFDWSQCDLLKCWLDSLPVLSAWGKMFYLWMLWQKLLNCRLLDFPLLLSVNFVADQNKGKFLWFFWGSLVQELGDPSLDIFEWLNWGVIYSFIGDVVDQYAAIGSTIKGSSKASKFLLSCCIPDLNVEYFTSKLITLPSTITYFSMKSAPTVALYDCKNFWSTYLAERIYTHWVGRFFQLYIKWSLRWVAQNNHLWQFLFAH